MQHNPMSRSLFLPIVMIIVLLILLGGVGLLSYKLFFTAQIDNQIQTPTQKVPDAAGDIIMNLTPKDGGGTKLYAYDVLTGKFTLLPIHFVMPVSSFDGNKIIATGLSAPQEHYNDTAYRSASVGLIEQDNNVQRILYASSTRHSTFYNVQLSPTNEKYTFESSPLQKATSSRNTNIAQQYQLNEQTIYLGTVSTGTPQRIANGAYAHFSPDGSEILYLSNDGFHLFNIDSQEDKVVLPPVNENYHGINIMPAISRDGTKIAIANPALSQVIIGDITSWNPFTVDNVHSYDIQALWPVFSPDSNWLALEQFDWNLSTDKLSEPTDKKLSVMNVSTGEIKELTSLDTYKQSGIFMSDWVKGI